MKNQPSRSRPIPTERRYWMPLSRTPAAGKRATTDDAWDRLQTCFDDVHNGLPSSSTGVDPLVGVVLSRRKEKGKRSLLCDLGQRCAPAADAPNLLRVQLAIRETHLDRGDHFELLLKEVRRGAVLCVEKGLPFVSGSGVPTVLCSTVKVVDAAPARGDAESHRARATNQLQPHRYQSVSALSAVTMGKKYLRSAPGQAQRSRRETHLHRYTFLWRELGWRPRAENSAISKPGKSERHEAFASWLVDRFGSTALRRGVGVLDVAGGKGLLTQELTLVHDIPCTLIEPRPLSMIERHDTGNDQGHQVHIEQWQGMFTREAVASDPWLHRLVSECSLIVGLHPDEATDAIVDLALEFEKPFAVVPCCVFSRKFPLRLLHGKPVSKYTDLLQYLIEKHETIQMDVLRFRGRRHCVYRRDMSQGSWCGKGLFCTPCQT